MWPWNWNGQQEYLQTETGISTASQTDWSAGWADQWWPDMMTPQKNKKKKTWKMEVKINFIQFFFVISCHCCSASGCTWGMPNWISHWVQMSAARIRFGMCSLSSAGECRDKEEEWGKWRPEILSLCQGIFCYSLQSWQAEATRIAQTHASSTVPHSMSKYSSPLPLFLPLLLQCHKIAWI